MRCEGEVDLDTVGRLGEAVDLALDAGPRRLVLDLTGVSLFGSEGIREVLRARDRCLACGVALEVRQSPQVERVLGIAGVAELFGPPDRAR